MTLANYAYLVVEDSTGEAVFEFHADLAHTSDLEKSFIMAERGQYIREVFNQAPVVGDIGDTQDRRAGFFIDGGAGSWGETIEFAADKGENVRWGDGSGGTGPDNVTAKDATGANVSGITRSNVFELWMARTITDSRNPGRLHFGEWTDGRFPESDAGAMGQPMPVAVMNHNVSTDTDDPGRLSGSVDVQHISLFADADPPDWLSQSSIGGFVQGAAEALGVIPDE